MSLLRAEGLRFERGGRVIFEGVSLSVRPGDRVAVTGPSGTGKTSLLSVLAGFAAPAAGTVRRGGELVTAGTLPARTAAVPHSLVHAGSVDVPAFRRGCAIACDRRRAAG